MFIDTHAHLDHKDFRGEAASVLKHALDVNVKKIINVGVNVESSKKSAELARLYPEIYATIGIHPEESAELDLESRMMLTQLIANKKVVAIGEIGLDYYYLKRSSQFSSYPRKEKQFFCFEQMLDTALEFHLPVVIHSREAEKDTLSVLAGYKSQIRGVIHCFSGNYEFAKKILDLGFIISFTGNITYKNSYDTQDALKKIPLGSMMLETDSPLLSPESKRGERNEPANIIEIAHKIAEIKNISLAEVESTTTKKAESFFKLH